MADRRILAAALVAFASCATTETEAPATAAPEATAVWMDVDPAVLRGGNEPDDGLALLQAFHSPELELRGVSVVFGNSPLETGFPNGREIVDRFGPEGLTTYRGAASGEELGEETNATRALADALQKERLTILALGPVTNVATVLRNHPELAGRIEKIVAVAGRRPGQRFVLGEGGTPLMDFNFELDPEGFQVLLDSGVPIVLAPFEIAAKAPLTENAVERFAEVPEIAEFFLEPLRDYVNWYDESFGVRAIYPFDTLAVAHVTSPAWIQCEVLPVEIQTLPNDVRADGDKPYLVVSDELESPHQVTYCHTADEAFVEDLVRRLLGRR